MIAVGSLIGFVLAFVALAWALSGLAGAVVRWQRRRLVAMGPAAERAAAAAAVVAPPALAAAAVAASATSHLGGADHCAVDLQHLHLCLAHGGAWASQAVPVAIVAGLAAALVIATARGAARIVAARRIVAALRRGGVAHDRDGWQVVVAPSPYRLSLTAGLVTPRVYLSTAVWDALDDDERAAVIGHELAHVRGHDVKWGFVLGALATLGAPVMAPALLRRWHAATERLRDHDAARSTGDAALVGAALIKVARVPAAARLAGAAGLSADDELAARVEALLAGRPAGHVAARRIATLAWLGGAAALVAVVLGAGPVHHALETLLGPL